MSRTLSLIILLIALPFLAGAQATTACTTTSCVQNVALPTTPVSVANITENAATTSATALPAAGFFSVAVGGVPAGAYAIANQSYAAWCADYENAPMGFGGFSGVPYSTYGTSLANQPYGVPPTATGSVTAAQVWAKVNWVLNHKAGSVLDVQQAIWKLLTGAVNGTLSGTAQTLVNAADATFVPSAGQVFGVYLYVDGFLAPGVFTAQDILIEVPCTSQTNPPTFTAGCPSGTGVVGEVYNSAVTAQGGVVPYAYAVGTGALPTGLTLNATTGAITGTATAAGNFGFTIKVTDSTGAVAYSSCGANCSTSVTATWNFAEPVGQLGPSQAYTASGLAITAAAYADGGTPRTLYAKVTSGDVYGLGVSGTTNNEIDTQTFVQLDLGGVIAAGATSAKMMVSGVGYGESYKIYGSNTPGQIGALLATKSADMTPFSIPGYPQYRYVSLKAASGRVLLASATFDVGSCSIKISTAFTFTCGACGGPSATVGQPYSAQLSLTGGSGRAYYSIVSGDLPDGLWLSSSDGTVRGTPTEAGTFTVTFKVRDNNGQTAQVTCTIVVKPAPLTVQCGTCASSAKPVIGVRYSANLQASGGIGPYTFALAQGAILPPGLTLAANGAITGTPTAAATYTFATVVTDSSSPKLSVTQTCTIVVTAPPVDLQCGACSGTSSGTVGVAFTAALSVTGGVGPFTYTKSSGTLPTGLNLTGNTISGTPSAAGDYTFTIKVTDANGQTDTATCTIHITSYSLDITCGTCDGSTKAQVGQAYSKALGVRGGSGSNRFSISSGSLPPGLTLNPSTGVISGSPTTAGTYTFTSKVTDSTGHTDTATCKIVVTGSVQLSCGACAGSIKGTVGASYSASLSASGGWGGYTYSIVSGSLPPGLSLNSSTGAITGRPTTPGTFSFTAKVVDSWGRSDTDTCSITVIGAAIDLLCGTCGAGNGQVGQLYDVFLKVNNGTAPYAYTATGLPSWLTLNASTGELKGTPTAGGVVTFTTKVVDKNGNSDTVTCSIQVDVPALDLQCGSCGAGSAREGVAYTMRLTATGGSGQYTYSLVSGTLPPGLTLNNGTISGTPTKDGFYPLTFKVTDTANHTDTATCYIRVSDSCN